MAPPPYYMLITHSVSFDITSFTGGTCSLDVKIKKKFRKIYYAVFVKSQQTGSEKKTGSVNRRYAGTVFLVLVLVF